MTESKEQTLDKTDLIAANENIWYVLATIAGEPQELFDPISEKNRYYWNGLMRERMANAKIVPLMDKDNNEITLPKLTNADWDVIRETLDRRGFAGKDIPEKNKGMRFSNDLPEHANFDGFVFVGITSFAGTKFNLDACFRAAIFTERVDFYSATIESDAYFSDAIFMGSVNFSGTNIKNHTNFNKAIFHGVANFTGVGFGMLPTVPATFNEAIFKTPVNFYHARFYGKPNFNSCVFQSTINFTCTLFMSHPPNFFGVTLTGDILWSGVYFPKPSRFWNIAEEHKNYYERLALMMSKLEKTHDQHMFFRHEMRARRALGLYKDVREALGRKCKCLKWIMSIKAFAKPISFVAKAPSFIMNWIYDYGFGYGYGFGRALFLWFAHIIGGGALIYALTKQVFANPCADFVNAIATSFSNAHSFLGLNKGPLKTVYAEYGKLDCFNVVWTVQSLLGILFLFFLLLTIRNRFKMG